MAAITLTHYVYLAFVIAILVFIALKKDTVLLTLVGLLAVSTMTKGSLVGGIQGVFNSIYQSAINMFIIPILIAVIFALTKLLKETGADYLMVAPLRRFLNKPSASFWILGAIMFVLSLFFWPTAAAGLVGAILVPVAVTGGLSPLAAAIVLSMFGHGAALSGDWVLQGAPTILAKASGIPIESLLSTSTYIVGGSILVGSIVAFFMLRKELKMPVAASEVAAGSAVASGSVAMPIEHSSWARFTSIIIPVAFVADLVIMIKMKLIGGDATALLGGTVLLLLAVVSLLEFKGEALTKLVDYLRAGFVFAIEIFTPVFVISAFFMIGSPDGAAMVFGKGAPGYMVELGQRVASLGAVNKVSLALIQVVVSAMTGLDGAGFDQLPLIGSLARSLAPAIGANPAPLAVLGQMATIWTAGALVPWGFMAALAAFCGVSPIELARRNFIPTICAFVTGTIIAIFLM